VIILWRRHVPPCTETSREFVGCKCPIHLDWRVGSQRIRKSMKTRNWQKAVADARRMEIEGFKEPGTSPAIAEATKQYLADAAARGLREPTLYKFKLLFRQMEEFGKEKGLVFVSDFTVDRTREFRESWPNKNFAAQKKLESLRAFFRFCQDAGWIDSNPAKKLKAGKTDPPQIIPFTDEEIEKILKACRKHPNKLNRVRLRALILLMRYTGLRIRDAVTLSRDRIQDGKLFLRTAKTGTHVYCPLPPVALKALAAIPGNSSYYFWSGGSKPKSAVGDYQRALHKLFATAGVPGAHPHKFRHTFATTLLGKGVSVETVARLLGHKNPQITIKHYDHWIRGRQEELEKAVRKSW
jgi:integrase/recombinase XerD